jgi:hypothetical protein
VTTYFRGFEEGDGISDFTEVPLVSTNTAPAWSIVNTNEVHATSASAHSESLVWNDIDGDANRADFEILCQVYVDSSSTTHRFLAGRVSTSGASRTGYSCRVRTTSIDIYHSTGSTFTSVSGATISITSGTWCWVRFRVNGTTCRARIWVDGDSEPGTWNVDSADSTYSTAGHVGLLKGNNTTTQKWRKLGVGTNGDTAPASGGGGNVSVALTGQSATASAGTLAPSASRALAGQAAAASAGTVTQGALTALAGQSATTSAGTLTPSASVPLSGQAATVSAGTVTYTADGAITVALTGSLVTASAGTLTLGIVVPLSGQSVAANAGTVTYTADGAITVALTGSVVTASAGTLAPVRTVATTGSVVTASAGTLVSARTVAATGSAVTASAGTIVYDTAGDVNVALSGQAVTVFAGTLTAVGAFRSGNPLAWIVDSRQRYVQVDARLPEWRI